ncbi:hypothetical protein TYRP_019653 [Tyrophagus putrescentiae]|nr:hypothetical protein TYRP_019653 [Tyrophagus putrescentiae]
MANLGRLKAAYHTVCHTCRQEQNRRIVKELGVGNEQSSMRNGTVLCSIRRILYSRIGGSLREVRVRGNRWRGQADDIVEEVTERAQSQASQVMQ